MRPFSSFHRPAPACGAFLCGREGAPFPGLGPSLLSRPGRAPPLDFLTTDSGRATIVAIGRIQLSNLEDVQRHNACMLFNPYIAIFASGGLVVLMTSETPSRQGVAIGIICVLASAIGRFVWEPKPAPKRGAYINIAPERATPAELSSVAGLPAGVAPASPHPALLGTVRARNP